MPLGSSACLIATSAAMPRRIAEPCQFVALHLSDAMFGGDRAARCDHQIVHEGADLLAGIVRPGAAVCALRRGNMEVDVAIAQVPEGGDLRAGKARLDALRRPR